MFPRVPPHVASTVTIYWRCARCVWRFIPKSTPLTYKSSLRATLPQTVVGVGAPGRSVCPKFAGGKRSCQTDVGEWIPPNLHSFGSNGPNPRPTSRRSVGTSVSPPTRLDSVRSSALTAMIGTDKWANLATRMGRKQNKNPQATSRLVQKIQIHQWWSSPSDHRFELLSCRSL